MPFANGIAGAIHWEDVGDGPPVVLLHGLGGDISFWDAEVTAWSQDHRLVLVDLRGVGGTVSTPDSLSIEELADDVVAVMDDSHVTITAVVGFSMGGLVAQSLALRHAQRISRLVLASTYARMSVQARLFLDAVLSSYEMSGSAAQMFRLVYPWLFSPDFLGSPEVDKPAWPTDEELADQSFEDWRALYLAQREFDATSRLGEISCETLVVAGEQDRLVPLEDTRALAAGITHSQLSLLPNTGHLINVEAPETFQTTIDRFLQI
jgi:3-oxoadipate enol-lactonase